MKKIFVVTVLILCVAMAVAADEKPLIDFSVIDRSDEYGGENEATYVEFGTYAGTTYNEQEKAEMNTSLWLENWKVRLSSSSRTIMNDTLCQVARVIVNEAADGQQTDANPESIEAKREPHGKQVLGIRVHYPTGSFNSYAWVEPPFDIPAYATHGSINVNDMENLTDEQKAAIGNQFNGWGVLKNVGTIKEVSVKVFGMNYPMGMAVVLIDDDEQTQEIPMGYLNFDGWKTLTWQNPNYIYDVAKRTLRAEPLYPSSAPSVTLDSLQFYRDAMQEGGDFICYVKDIYVKFDKAVLDDGTQDIEHEQVWGILAAREKARREAELRRLGNEQVLRYLEEQKMHKDPETSGAEN